MIIAKSSDLYCHNKNLFYKTVENVTTVILYKISTHQNRLQSFLHVYIVASRRLKFQKCLFTQFILFTTQLFYLPFTKKIDLTKMFINYFQPLAVCQLGKHYVHFSTKFQLARGCYQIFVFSPGFNYAFLQTSFRHVFGSTDSKYLFCVMCQIFFGFIFSS